MEAVVEGSEVRWSGDGRCGKFIHDEAARGEEKKWDGARGAIEEVNGQVEGLLKAKKE